MRKIALVNQKGGVGKTTTAQNLAAALHILDKKVLVIDMDPQANLTYSFGIKSHELDKTIYEVLKGECDVKKAIIKQSGISIIPSTLDLAGFDIEFSVKMGRENRLKNALKDLNSYDYVLIDCPPSLGLLTLNALIYSNEVYIILQPEFLALKGMSRLLQTVEEVKKENLNDDLEITGIILTMCDPRKNLHKEIADKIGSDFSDVVFKTVIRQNVSLSEAQSFGQHVFKYKANSHGAEDYKKLAQEIIKRK